jgi:ABC-2 type transport system ATP-binding protein
VTDAAIEVRGLQMAYGRLEAVRGIDLTVAHGEVFALLGPNGAGKTSTIEILEGFRRRTGGDVSVLGHDPEDRARSFRRRIGVVLQEATAEPYLKVGEVVDLYRGYYPDPRPVADVLGIVGLTEQSDQLVRRLSGGQQRRLDVALGLAGDPDLLFLDEPTTGFDPGARRQAWDMVGGLSDLGKTVVLTTHYMDEAQALADRVAVLMDGRIVAEGSPDQLGGRGSEPTTVHFVDPGVELPAPLAAVTTVEEGRSVARPEDPVSYLHELTGWALGAGLDLDGLEVRRPSLEDVYLQLTDDGEP